MEKYAGGSWSRRERERDRFAKAIDRAKEEER